MKPCLVYLSGPIKAAHGYSVDDNVREAGQTFLDLTRRGIPSFCPHLGALVPGAFDVPYETWMAYDFAVLDRCTHVLMLPRWETSAGAKREKDYAFLRGIQTFYSLDELEAYLERTRAVV